MWLAFAFFLLSQASGNDFSAYLQRGIEETRKGEFGSALVDLQNAAHSNPKSAEVEFRIGLLLGQMADFRGAEAAFEKAIELQPSYAEAHYNLGLAQIADAREKLDWPDAIKSFQLALQYRPDYAEAASQLGAGLLATGDADGALQQLERATRLKPSLAEAHLNLGLAWEAQGKNDNAEAAYRIALKARPRFLKAQILLGKLLMRKGQLDLAQSELRSALRFDPDSSDAHYALALAEQAGKKNASAEFEQFRALSKRKTDAAQSALLSNEGLQAAQNGDIPSAIKLERQAVALKPDSGVPHYNLALVVADSGDWGAASRELVKAASLMPGSFAPWFDLGRVLKRKADTPAALRCLVWAHRLAPSNARVASEIEELSSAEKPSRSLPVVLQPPFGPIADTAAGHLRFATELSHAGDDLGAVGELLRVLVLEPGNVQARRNLAAAYQHLNLPAEAALEQARIAFLTPAS